MEFLQNKMVTCQRFAVDVLLPIGRVYNVSPLEWLAASLSIQLAPDVINIFWDHEGPLIAFNRGGTIFCNA